MILDVTAGNRTMWREKDSPIVVYLDVEKRLARPPDVIADSRHLPFRDGVFDTVVFDPPHLWGFETGAIQNVSPNVELSKVPVKRKVTSYYGWDKYKTRSQLLKYIVDTLREVRRVLKPDGVLWFKWCDLAMPIEKFWAVFDGWREMLRLGLDSPMRRSSRGRSWFIMFRPLCQSIRQLKLFEGRDWRE